MDPDDGHPLQELAAVKPAAWSTSSSLSLAVSGARRGQQQPVDEEWLDDDTHWQRCAESGDQANCARCRFEAGFAGMLRRGASGFQAENDSAAWKNLFQFQHPTAGWRTWLTTKPHAWGGKWSMGCWICAHYEPPRFGSSFGRLEVSMKNTVAPSSFKKHEGSQSHLEAVAAMKAQLAAHSSEGLFTQATDAVPRLEKFYLAGLVVSRHDTFTDFEHYLRGLALTCPLPTGSDVSRPVCCQMIRALAKPLYDQDQSVIEHSSSASIAFDVRDELLLVVGRFAYHSLKNGHLPPLGLYECLLGTARVKKDSGPRASATTVEFILKQACHRRNGRMTTLDSDLWNHLKATSGAAHFSNTWKP